MENTERCPSCGYTKEDAQIHMDHHLCKNAGKAPWEQDLIPDMPAWLKAHLQSLTEQQKDELFAWINSGDDSAVLETIQETISLNQPTKRIPTR